MKQNFSYIMCLLACSFFLSCEDNRDQNMSPDKVYLVKTGMHLEESFDVGENVVLQLWANKSGLNKTPCTVTFTVNPEGLEQYNTENGTHYELLPADCYAIPQSVFDVSGNEQYAKWFMEYDPRKILLKTGGEYGETNFVLPVTIRSEGAETTQSNTALFRFKVNEPTVRMLTRSFDMVRVFEGSEADAKEPFIERKIEIGMSFVNQWEATVTLENDRTALKALLDGAKSKVRYFETRLTTVAGDASENFSGVLTHIDGVLPPADAYSVSTDMSIKKGADKITITYTIDKSKLYPGVNIIPVKLTGVTEPLKVDPDNDICYIAVQYVPDRTAMPIKSSSSHQTVTYAPKRIAGLFDGDFDTSWRPGVGTASFPSGIGNDNNPAIVVDLGKDTDVSAVELWTRGPGQRQGSRTETYRTSPAYITNVKVYVSSDNQCWEATNGEFLLQGTTLITTAKNYWGEPVVNYDWLTQNPGSAPCTLTFPDTRHVRYVIIWYTKNANQADIWELFVYGNRQ